MMRRADAVASMIQSRRGKRLVHVLVWGLGLLAIELVIICAMIGSGVHAISSLALREYQVDKVVAFMALVVSARHTFKDGNRAVSI